MVGKGNLAVFEGSSISETEIVMPTKIGVHALHIHPYLHEFFELKLKSLSSLYLRGALSR